MKIPNLITKDLKEALLLTSGTGFKLSESIVTSWNVYGICLLSASSITNLFNYSHRFIRQFLNTGEVSKAI